jgi:hypothetical protein
MDMEMGTLSAVRIVFARQIESDQSDSGDDGTALHGRSTSSQYKRDNEKNEKGDEEYPGYLRGYRFHAAKTERSRDQREY